MWKWRVTLILIVTNALEMVPKCLERGLEELEIGGRVEIQITAISEVVKLATVVEGGPKSPFSIATTPRCRGGCNSFS